MANITSLRGLVYNSEKINDLAEVTTPPYDVISKKEQDFFHERHPQNIIRLILGEKRGSDTDTENWFTRAAHYFRQWQNDKFLIRDPQPALYYVTTEFTVEGETFFRHGLISRVEIEPFENGIVLPHEKTFSRIKSERLELMNQCHANFSPIFSLFPDPENTVLSVLDAASAGNPPDMDFWDSDGHRQRLWRVTTPSVIETVRNAMKEMKIYIADGHHRYETALAYRDRLKSLHSEWMTDHPANFVLMYLTAMQDPGLVIRPAHRMLKEIDPEIMADFPSKAAPYFDVTVIPFDAFQETAASLSKFRALHKPENTEDHVFGVAVKCRKELLIIRLKPGVMKERFGEEIPEALIGLDVTVLTRLIFMDILGFNRERLDNDRLIAYSSIDREAVEGAQKGKCDMAFILNPTRIDQICQVSHEGLIMPRKSTYFYPKVVTGQVISPLTPDA